MALFAALPDLLLDIIDNRGSDKHDALDKLPIIS